MQRTTGGPPHASKLLTLVVILEKHDFALRGLAYSLAQLPYPHINLVRTFTLPNSLSGSNIVSPQLYFSKVGYSFPLGARGFAVSALFGTPQRFSSRQLTFLLRRWGLSSMSRSFRRRNSPMSCGFYSGFGAGR